MTDINTNLNNKSSAKKSFIDRIIEWFKPDPDDNKNEHKIPHKINSDDFSNETIEAELASLFENTIRRKSVGERMIYPMIFNITMEESDFNEFKDSLIYAIPEFAKELYRCIARNVEKRPIYTPPMGHWTFRFTSNESGKMIVENNTDTTITKGQVIIDAIIPSPSNPNNNMATEKQSANSSESQSNVRVTSSANEGIRTTRKGNLNFKKESNNINQDAIKDISILDNYTFQLEYDSSIIKTLLEAKKTEKKHEEKKVDEKPRPAAETPTTKRSNGIAELSYTQDSRTYYYDMMDELINISGRKDERKGREYFKIENDFINDSHVQIRYNKAESQFEIAAFGHTRLNERTIDESKGGDIKWYVLPDNSNILINSEVDVTFKIKQK